MNYLEELEAESISILRESAIVFKRPVILFSGGKDSLTLLHLCKKAFYPFRIPFDILHIDTGHNFSETLKFRDKTITALGVNLIVRSVIDSIRLGRVKDTGGSRNSLQTTTLLDAMTEFNFDSAIGGARRDEEKARAKERIFSLRDSQGKWNPSSQRPELWNLYNGYMKPGQQMRVFPLSNWTELDIWSYIRRENLALPSLYFTHKRLCLIRKGVIIPASEELKPKPNEKIQTLDIRFRTVGDITCSAAVESKASNAQEVINEICSSPYSERSGRIDDRTSEWSMSHQPWWCRSK